MGKKKKKKQLTFDEHYSVVFGSRWEPLKEALLEPGSHYALEEGLIQPYFLDYASVVAAKTLTSSWSGISSIGKRTNSCPP